MKKHLIILLLITFVLNTVGSGAFFLYIQTQYCKVMWESLKNDLKPEEFSVLEFSPNDYAKLDITDNEDEFNFKGKMYDIIRIIKSNDRIIVHCVNDEVEEKLVKNFFNSANKSKPEHGNMKNIRINLLAFCSIEKNTVNLIRYYKKDVKYIQSDIYFTITYFPEIHTPPPKNLV